MILKVLIACLGVPNGASLTITELLDGPGSNELGKLGSKEPEKLGSKEPEKLSSKEPEKLDSKIT